MKSAVRRLVKVGKRSYAVVIPKRWVELLGIKPGDSIYLVLGEDGSLTMAPLRGPEGKEAGPEILARLAVSATNARALTKLLLALYSASLRGVVLGGTPPQESLSLPTELASVELGEGHVVVHFKDIRAGPEEVLEDMARKVQDVFKLFTEGLERPSPELWSRIHEIERELDVSVHLVIRLTIRKVVVETLKKGLDSETLVESLLNVLAAKVFEDLSDCVDRSAHRIEELLPLSKDFAELFTRVRDLSGEIFECYLRRCLADEAFRLLERTTGLRKELKEVMAISAPPLLPLLAELDTAVTLLEDLLEAALIRIYK